MKQFILSVLCTVSCFVLFAQTKSGDSTKRKQTKPAAPQLQQSVFWPSRDSNSKTKPGVLTKRPSIPTGTRL